jgi:hypothetical protein
MQEVGRILRSYGGAMCAWTAGLTVAIHGTASPCQLRLIRRVRPAANAVSKIHALIVRV